MAQAPLYNRTTQFAGDELNNAGGRSTVRTAQVDAELDAISTSVNQTRNNLALLQRDDTRMRDSVVELHTLAVSVLALIIAAGGQPRGAWVTATAYAVKDVVTQGGNTYVCAVAHTSGTFATDLAAVKWLLYSLGANPAAASVPFTPTATLSSTNAQAAIEEADTENRALTAAVLADLLATAVAAKGAGMVGFGGQVAYGTGTVGKKLRERISVDDFGADGTGSVDAATAVQAAIDYVEARGGGEVFFPGTVYLLGATLTIDSVNVTLRGTAGSGDHITINGGTTLRATHSAGPVIRVKKSGISIVDLVVSSDATRYAGAAGTNYGIWVEASDSAGESTKRTLIKNVRITQQPTSALVMIADIVSSRLDFVSVDNCDGHAFVINSGNFTSRANKGRAGQLQIDNCRASRVGGHALLIGGLPGTETAAEDVPYRCQVDNFECFYVCSDAAFRLNQYCAIVYGENHEFNACAWGGLDSGGADANGGLYVLARFSNFVNTRFVDCTPYAAYVANNTAAPTEDVTFKSAYINSVNHGASYYNPAIFVEAACANVSAEAHPSNTDVAALIGFSGTNTESKFRKQQRWSGSSIASTYRSSAAELSINDDKAAYLSFDGPARGILELSGNTSGAKGAVVHFRCGDASNHATIMANSGGGVVGQTGTLAGTTGVDTNLTISADSATNRIYIENRTGATRGYSITLLNVVGDVLFIGTTNLP